MFVFQKDMSEEEKSVNYWGAGHGEGLLIITFWFYIFLHKGLLTPGAASFFLVF